MQELVYVNENDNKRTSFWLSVIFHLILLFLFLVPCFNYFKQKPPEFKQGIVIALGNPDSEKKTNPKKSAKSAVQPSKSKAVVPAKKPTKPKAAKAVKTPVAKKVVSKLIQKESSVVATKEKVVSKVEEKVDLEKKKLEEERKQKALEEVLKRQKEAEAKAKREEEARKKAEAKSEAKSKFSSLFGKGDEDANDSKGDINGKPDANVLDGLSTGSGKVGDGLGERGVLFIPTIRDNTQKTGKVVVKICVNQDGKVISANYTQKGSTTTDSHLIDVAEKNAKKYKFSKSTITEQCGNVIINFKLK